MTCPECGGAFVKFEFERQTLVGFSSPPGHVHDDNCRKRDYVCGSGHVTVVSRRMRCPREGCDWCDCHHGLKVDQWPEPTKGRWIQ